jgi:hypothetical protein
MSIEAMKQAVEAFEHIKKYVTDDGAMPENWDAYHEKEYFALEALRQAIEQAEKQEKLCKYCGGIGRVVCDGRCMPEQEPVAWMVLTQDDKKLMLYGEEKPSIFNTPVKLIPLYIAPSKREWVRLTDEEIEGIAKRLVADASYCSLHFAVAIQGAFMRKNI